MKLQITAIFEGAYKFLFANVLAIIGIVWLPYALAMIVTALAVMGAVPAQWWHGDFSQMSQAALLPMIPRFIGLCTLVTFVWLVTLAMITVAIQRRALGLMPGPVFAYFSLAAPVWRLIGAYILVNLLIMGAAMGVILCCALAITEAKSAMSHSLTVLIGTLCGIAGVCAFFYVVIRWLFFIPPVVVAEGHIGLRRAWQLGGGNFWRILAIIILVYLPISIVGSMLMQVFVPIFGGPLNNFPQHPTGAQVGEALHQIFFALLPALGISMLIQTIAQAAVSNGAKALAYRQMLGTQPQGN